MQFALNFKIEFDSFRLVCDIETASSPKTTHHLNN